MMIDNKLSHNQKPLVSVIMSCFNGSKFLKEAIESVINQNYQNWELIFWDNLSDDNSFLIAKNYSNLDNRVRCFQSKVHDNISVARNKAIDASTGEIITFLDVDDYWHTDKLSKQVDIFEIQNCKMVYSNYTIYNHIKKTKKKAFKHNLPNGSITQDLINFYCVGLLTIAFKRDVFFEFQQFDSQFHIIGDFDIVLKISSKYRIGCINRELATYRLHKKNESNLKRNIRCKEMSLWLNSYFVKKNLNHMSLEKIENDIIYCNAVTNILNGKKILVLKSLFNIKSNWLKFRLITMICIPSFIAKIINTYRLNN